MNQTVPKIWLAHSLTLAFNLQDNSFNQETFEKFQGEVKPFAELLEKYKEEILRNIPQFTGIKWFKKEIPVYLVNSPDKKSFAFPLILFWKGNIHNRLIALIHELVHINILADSDNFSDINNPLSPLKDEQTEAANWLVVKMVINHLPDNQILIDELDKWAKSSSRNQEIFALVEAFGKKWNLQEKALINWIAELEESE